MKRVKENERESDRENKKEGEIVMGRIKERERETGGRGNRGEKQVSV